MFKLLAATALIAIVPAGATMAQQTRVTTTVTTTAPATVNPEAADAASAQPAVQPAPPAQASLGADGVIHEWGPQEPVAQAVPPPAKAYPPCTRGRTDSCYNPDPSKEADVRKDGKIGA